MPGFETLGRWLIVVGLVIALLGGLIWLATRLFPNISQLPGTIRIQSETFTCVFPLLASIIISVFLTIVLNLLVRLFHK